MSSATRSRAMARASWTLVRFGKAGWRSTSGPSSRSSLTSSRARKITQCGLPTDSATTDTRCPTTSMVVRSSRNRGTPMSTVTCAPRTSTAASPPWVCTTNRGDATRPVSYSHLAKMRRPLPLFSASDPSGLKMRTPRSPSSSINPSEPTPTCRSHNRRTRSGVTTNGSSAGSATR